jgi:acyl-CoA reductase-like NAD-dependent aldehyde dehydrogenase
LNGQWVASKATQNIPIINPLDNTETIGLVPQTTEAEFNAIVQNA